MGIDHSMYRTQFPDLMGNFMQGMNMRDMMDQKKLQKEQLAEEQGIKQAFGAGMKQGPDGKMQFDQQATLGQLAQINPQKAFEFQEQMKSQQMQDEQERLKKQMQEIDLSSRLLGSVSDQQTYDKALMTAKRMGLDVDELPRSYDPGFVRAAQLQGLTAKEQLAHRMSELGLGATMQNNQSTLDLKRQQLGLQQQELGLKKRGVDLKEQQMNQPSKALPKLSNDYRWNEDGTAAEPIPGTKAWMAHEKERRQLQNRAETITRAGQTLIRDVTTSIDTINKYGDRAAGWGSLIKFMPKSASNALAADIASIQGNVAVDQLLKIKAQGAGLGQVPQSQLEMLASLLGGLRQDMDPQKLKANLEDIRSIYTDIVNAEGGDPFTLAINRGWNPDRPDAPLPDNRSGRSGFAPKSRGFQPGQRQQQAIPAQPMPDITPEMRRGALEELARRRQMAGQRGGR
jgi:hypothetical protein